MSVWTTPKTWLNAILTAADLNTHVRDNLSFLYSPPKVYASRSAAKSITNATVTQYDFDQESYDTDAMHSTSTNTTRVTIKTAGVYVFTAAVSWASNTTGRRLAQFLINGATTGPADDKSVVGGAGGEHSVTLVWSQSFAVNDYVELNVYQNSGGALNCTATIQAHFLSN